MKKRLALLIVAFILIFSICPVVSAQSSANVPYNTYAYWEKDGEREPVEIRSVYEVYEKIDGYTLGVDGFEMRSAITCDSNGNYYSASLHFQVKGEKTTVGAGISTAFKGIDSDNLSVSYTRENNLVTFTATEEFTSYYWTLDGTSVAGSANTLSVDLDSLTTGIHIVTVIAKAGSGVYYSANAQISKASDITLDIKCSGITILFSSENTETFFVTIIRKSQRNLPHFTTKSIPKDRL